MKEQPNLAETNQYLQQIQLKLLRPQNWLSPKIRRHLPHAVLDHPVKLVDDALRGYRTFEEGARKLGREIAQIGGLTDHEMETVGKSFQIALEAKAIKPLTKTLLEVEADQAKKEGNWDLVEEIQHTDFSTFEEEITARQLESDIRKLYSVAVAHIPSLPFEQFEAWEHRLLVAGAKLALYFTFSENMPPTIDGIKSIVQDIQDSRPQYSDDFADLNVALTKSEVKKFKKNNLSYIRRH